MILLCILLSALLLVSPISVCASELADPIEPTPMFYGYKVLGYDDLGNAVLSNDDYVEYFNARLQERAEDIADGVAVIDAQPVPFSSYSVQTYDFLDDLDETKFVDKTRFIDLPNWLGYAFDFAKYILQNPTMSAGGEVRFSEKISSIGKKRLYYTKADTYENITCGLNFDYSTKEDTIRLTRSGFGALSTFYLYSQENTSITLTWSASGYAFKGTNQSSSGASTSFEVASTHIRMDSFSVNILPETKVSQLTIVSDNSSYLYGNNSTPAIYAENTFATNSRDYNANHTLIDNSKSYWNPVTIYNVFPAKSGDTINQNNINNYSQYGYSWNSVTNTVEFDPDVLAAYINGELLPQLMALYIDAYQHFPDVDADINDQDITYYDPFDDGSETDTLPPATFPPGGGLTPSELDAVLNSETFYILDMDTDIPALTIDTLPAVDNLPAGVSSAVAGISTYALNLFDTLGLTSIFIALTVLGFVVFLFRG